MSSTPLNQTNKSEVNQKMVEAANCRHCFLTGGAALGIPMLKCSRCGTAYCSKDCQVKDWPEHKKQCKIWAEVKNLNPNTKTMTKCYEDWSMLYSPTRLVLWTSFIYTSSHTFSLCLSFVHHRIHNISNWPTACLLL